MGLTGLPVTQPPRAARHTARRRQSRLPLTIGGWMMDDVKCTDCDGKGGSYAGPPCPSCRGTGIEQTSSEPVTYLGKKLRALAAEHGSGVTQLGTLFVRVTCHGNEWACELNDDKPIGGDTVGEWDKAVGVTHGGTWREAYNRMVMRCEWQGTEDAAPEGTKAFYLGGKP